MALRYGGALATAGLKGGVGVDTAPPGGALSAVPQCAQNEVSSGAGTPQRAQARWSAWPQ